MANLKLENVCKIYKGKNGEDIHAVTNFSLSSDQKEFIVFVGPSGCGKSTTLRMIAGLEDISSGDLFIDGERMNDIESKYRNIAMVFQNYALYPHMTAYQNMAFGLKNNHVPKEEIETRIKAAAKILDIEKLLNRKPKSMSGGQRQRVALGRAIVRTPKLFLLDEPLSNLDAKLRGQMRVEITKLYEKLNTTFVYVTHDQVEAMTMGTRIVVMRDGYIQQIDEPTRVYDFPANRFVAGFLGTPQMNFFESEVASSATGYDVSLPGGQTLAVSLKEVRHIEDSYLDGKNHSVILGIRPEDVEIVKEGSISDISAKIVLVETLGNESIIYADINIEAENPAKTLSIVIKSGQRVKLPLGSNVNLNLNASKIHLFSSETESSILSDADGVFKPGPGIPPRNDEIIQAKRMFPWLKKKE